MGRNKPKIEKGAPPISPEGIHPLLQIDAINPIPSFDRYSTLFAPSSSLLSYSSHSHPTPQPHSFSRLNDGFFLFAYFLLRAIRLPRTLSMAD